MVRVLISCFDVSKVKPLFPELKGKDIYEYRADPEYLLNKGNRDYYVVFMIRDPRDSLTSVHPSSGNPVWEFPSWKHNYNNYLKLKNKVNSVEIFYEHLLTSPEVVQNELAAFFPMKIVESFPNFFSKKDFCLSRVAEMEKEMGSLRPFDISRIGAWREPRRRDILSRQVSKYPELAEIVIRLGYEKDYSWLMELG